MRMKPTGYDTSARQNSGEPSPLLGRGGDRNSRSCSADMADVEAEIAGLFDRSTQQLRLAWREAHRTGPPVSLSRDLPIRGLANQLQERIHGGPAVRRRLHTMPGALEKGGLSADPGAVLRPVRHWCASGVDTPTPSSYATPGRRPAARKPITLR